MRIKTPDHIYGQSNLEKISIDDDIVTTIQKLWEAGFITLASGGGQNPWVQVSDIHNQYEIELIREICEKDVTRKWSIFQWRIEMV